MEVIVKTTKWETKIVDVKLELAEEPFYWFEFGRRVSWAAIPIFTSWNMKEYNKPEEIYQYKVILVDSDGEININQVNVSEIPSLYEQKGESIAKRFTQFLVDGTTDREDRTKERFLNDYKSVTNKIEEALNTKPPTT